MIDDLWNEARQLAARPYAVEFSVEMLTTGERIYFVETPELDGCMAQGATESEAIDNLYEARAEFIYSMLVDRLSVPQPAGESQTSNPSGDFGQGS